MLKEVTSLRETEVKMLNTGFKFADRIQRAPLSRPQIHMQRTLHELSFCAESVCAGHIYHVDRTQNAAAVSVQRQPQLPIKMFSKKTTCKQLWEMNS
jgi:hypothetical protein